MANLSMKEAMARTTVVNAPTAEAAEVRVKALPTPSKPAQNGGFSSFAVFTTEDGVELIAGAKSEMPLQVGDKVLIDNPYSWLQTESGGKILSAPREQIVYNVYPVGTPTAEAPATSATEDDDLPF